MEGFSLTAHTRRIAVYYSQLAAYQAKQDYGMSLESQISQQAQAELQFELDQEAVFMVKGMAEGKVADLKGNVMPARHVLKWTDEELD